MVNSQFQLYLAPFQGITDAVYRTSLARWFGGVNAVFTPYISGTGVEKVSKNKLVDVMPLANQGVRTIPQMLSKDAGEMLLLGKALADLGYTEANWNLGCPFPRVANKKRGSGLLPFPEMVRAILETLFNSDFPLQLSVKMRTGYFEHSEVFEMLETLQQFPITEITMHPRTGKQLYSGDASESAFADAEALTQLPLVWNGDIFTVSKWHHLSQKFPRVDRWMIGRGALMNPALPLAIADYEAYRQLDKLKALSGFLSDIYQVTYARNEGRSVVVSRMKAVWVYLCHSFADPVNAFRLIRKTRTPDDYLDAERRVLNEFELVRL